MTSAVTSDRPDDGDVVDTLSWGSLEELSRSVHVAAGNLQTTLGAILDTANKTIVGADFVGINLLRGDVFEPQAVLGDPPLALDALQQSAGRGPCIDCSREQQLIRVDEMQTESRWPEYVALASSMEIRAMLCVPLWVDTQRLGSISLYSHTPAAFTLREERVANLLAVQAAVALAHAQRNENLTIALLNRDVIGQAKGILMERHRITADAAFDLLSAASQRSNRKLSAVAEALANVGELPS